MFGIFKFLFGYFPAEAEIIKLTDAKYGEALLLFNGTKMDDARKKLVWWMIKEDVAREAQQRRTVAMLIWFIALEAVGGAALGAYVL